MARLETSAEHPVPVRVVAIRLGEWIARLGEIWVDGQIAQLNRRPGVATQFLVLRDPDANISLSVTCPRGVLPDSVSEGTRVVLRARPDFYLERGSLSLRALEVRQVGLGELLARLDALRRLLAAEGVFAPDRKRPLPFLPHTIGLITGRASAAERDVVENARRRLPGARFRIENVAMQGTSAVTEVVEALRRLDRDPEVDVVVIARGGGSVEDLLPFSNETLVRAVSDARTPVVSAIGHETDTPLLDLVSDVAASTPTDAAKRVVPDLAAETAEIDALRQRARSRVRARLDREAELMAGLPERLRLTVRLRLERETSDVAASRDRARRRLAALLEAGRADLAHVQARVRALSPQATLDRGYAVARRADGAVVRSPDEATGRLNVRVAGGEFDADPVRP
ncbi:exodeoxyribonuclease VII large subunit [Jatrophihabitans endophyticus]|uniref:exodeoxyribonuclease VII large subunit n=1 Tax=Jatrophihabitans endophyticus TaxID=1206085 RepID=UPI0026F1C8B5|nr:exodeoxyribonuclease VII large subunit [Jatrophihabitans endophyticus]